MISWFAWLICLYKEVCYFVACAVNSVVIWLYTRSGVFCLYYLLVTLAVWLLVCFVVDCV